MKIGFGIPHVTHFSGFLRRCVSIGNEFVDMGHEFYLIVSKETTEGFASRIPFKGKLITEAEAMGYEWDILQFSLSWSWYQKKTLSAERKKRFQRLKSWNTKKRVLAVGKISPTPDKHGCCQSLNFPGSPWIVSFQNPSSLFASLTCDGYSILNRSMMVPCGVSEGFQDLGLRGKKLTVGFFGRMCNQGLCYILDSFQSISSVDYRVISFEGEAQKWTWPREDIEFSYIHCTSEEDLVKIYSSIDIFISLEPRAGWSHTVAEAMACGCACICSSHGTMLFARDQETALVVHPRNPSEVVAALERLITDEQLRSRLSSSGYKEIRRFSWKNIAERYLVDIENPGHLTQFRSLTNGMWG